MRTAVGLELKAVRVIRRGDNQRILVPVHNGYLADHCLGEECNRNRRRMQHSKRRRMQLGNRGLRGVVHRVLDGLLVCHGVGHRAVDVS